MSQFPIDAPILPDARSEDLLSESLGLLAFAHYVLALVTALLMPAGLYLAWVGWELLHPAGGPEWIAPPGQELLDPLRWGAALFLSGGVLATLSLVHAGLLWYVGRSIAQRRRRRLCVLFSIFDLTYVPLGTALSVFTLLVLWKPEARARFD